MAPSVLSSPKAEMPSPGDSLLNPKKRRDVDGPGSVKDIKVFTPAPSRFVHKSHPLEPQTTEEVNGYFLEHWPFKTTKDRKKFVGAGFSRVTCLYFPLAKSDRIKYACMLLTILFLIDGESYIHAAAWLALRWRPCVAT